MTWIDTLLIYIEVQSRMEKNFDNHFLKRRKCYRFKNKKIRPSIKEETNGIRLKSWQKSDGFVLEFTRRQRWLSRLQGVFIAQENTRL